VTAKNVGGGPEVNTTNNQGSVGTTIHAPHLTLTKTVASAANAGEAFTTTLSVANTGTGSATNVVLTDDLPVGVYYSTALDLGSGPRPTSVLRKSDGTTTLTWNLGSVAGGAATSTSFTARSTLLAVAGTALADSAAASYQNSNGCVYVPATAAGSTSITEVRPTRDPLTAGYWKQHAEARTAELLARVQATDQRFDGADGSTPDGVLSSAEALTILSAGGNQPGPVKAQLLAVLFDLASRRINARTAIGSPLSNGLGLRTVGDAVRYAFGTLAQPVTTATARRYNDTTTVLERITAGQIEVY
jgi:uncharacterized repeat protein (TIGR01451 family)